MNDGKPFALEQEKAKGGNFWFYEEEIHEKQHPPSLESIDKVKIKTASIRKIVRENQPILDGPEIWEILEFP